LNQIRNGLATKDDVYIVIKKINEYKKNSCIQPYSATYKEVVAELEADVKQEINQLVKDGLIKFHRTMNDVSFDAVDL